MAVLASDVDNLERFFADTSTSIVRLVITYLTLDADRNALIVDELAGEIRSGRGVSLVLSDRKGHCHALRELLLARHGLDGTVLTSDTPLPGRRKMAACIQK